MRFRRRREIAWSSSKTDVQCANMKELLRVNMKEFSFTNQLSVEPVVSVTWSTRMAQM